MLRTGWTEEQVAQASPQALVALRHAIWLEQLAPTATFDVEKVKQELDDAEFDLREPKKPARVARARGRISHLRGELAKAVKRRAEVRALMWPAEESSDGQ